MPLQRWVRGWGTGLVPIPVATVGVVTHYTFMRYPHRTVLLPGGYTLTVGTNLSGYNEWRAYEFRSKCGTILFHGADWKPASYKDFTEDACIADLLSYFVLQPGDTDDGYFDAYNMAQWAFLAMHEEVEELKIKAMLVEEGEESFEDAEWKEEETNAERGE